VYSSPDITRMIKSRRIRWAGHEARIENRNPYRLLMAKPGRKRLLGRSVRRCINNIKIDLRELLWVDMQCICQAQDRDHWRSLVNLRVP
jgi:hypothetical protein